MKKEYRIYDNGGKTQDRYTAVFMFDPATVRSQESVDTVYCALAFDETPFSPLGFGQHTTAIPGKHLGRRIKLNDLPDDARRFVIQELESYSA